MKYLFLLLSAISLFPLILLSQPANEKVFGGYRSCEIFEVRFKNDKQISKEKVTVLNFDTLGSICEAIFYDKNKIIAKNKNINKYNEKNLLTESVTLNEKGITISSVKQTYNELGKISTTSMFTQNNEMLYKIYNVYDENGFVIEQIYENRIGEGEYIKNKTIFKNDKFGNKIQDFSNHSSSISVDVSAEIDLGTENKESKLDISNSQAEDNEIRYEYEYDNKNRIITWIRHGIGGTIIKKKYTYDDFNNVIEEFSFDENNKVYLKLENKFKK